MSVVPQGRKTFREYLDAEGPSDVKHEYFEGAIFAMAGGSPEHSLIATNIAAELRAGVRGRSCRVFTSDLRVRVAETGLATYPDVTVVCGTLERDPEDSHTILNPTVLVEVLSDSTEAYDRGNKAANYRRIPTLRAYVLASQREARIEVFVRNDDGTWTLTETRAGGTARIAALDCDLVLADLYAGVFDAAES